MSKQLVFDMFPDTEPAGRVEIWSNNSSPVIKGSGSVTIRDVAVRTTSKYQLTSLTISLESMANPHFGLPQPTEHRGPSEQLFDLVATEAVLVVNCLRYTDYSTEARLFHAEIFGESIKGVSFIATPDEKGYYKIIKSLSY